MLEIYSLKVDSILGLDMESEKAKQIDRLLDSERLTIVKRSSVNASGCATERGAGLLLQYVGKLYLSGQIEETFSDKSCSLNIKELDIENIIEAIGQPIDFRYEHGADGKPYWKDERMPFFNISHSDNTVVLAISDIETGIDIQKIKSKNELSLAKRFYSENEARLVENSCTEKFELFYRLWARKEALGKCTGKGVRPYLDVDVSDIDSDYMRQYRWTEDRVDDCFICVCSRI